MRATWAKSACPQNRTLTKLSPRDDDFASTFAPSISGKGARKMSRDIRDRAHRSKLEEAVAKPHRNFTYMVSQIQASLRVI